MRGRRQPSLRASTPYGRNQHEGTRQRMSARLSEHGLGHSPAAPLARKQPDLTPLRRRRRRMNPLAYWLLLPMLAVIGALIIYPVCTTLIASFFYNSSISAKSGFAGVQNYSHILADPAFAKSIVNTIGYVVFGTVLLVLGGLVTAITLRKGFAGRPLVLAILVLPWALPGIVEGLIWAWIYDPTYGVLNAILMQLHLISHPIVLIGGGRALTIFLVELVQVWQLIPLTTLMILASMQGIPDELYQAASIDGAGEFAKFFRITLPLIRPGLTIAIIESIVSAVTIFDIAYALTGGTGASDTNPVMAEIYNVAFVNQNFGQAYAGVFVVSLAVMVVSALIIKLLYRPTEYA